MKRSSITTLREKQEKRETCFDKKAVEKPSDAGGRYNERQKC